MEWISMKERPPKHDGRFLTFKSVPIEKSREFWGNMGAELAEINNRSVNSWEDGKWHGCLSAYITHWMPLPEPPLNLPPKQEPANSP